MTNNDLFLETKIGDSCDIKDDLKICYPIELETKITILRASLESWKQVIIPVYNVLAWKKQWHPPAIVGGTTMLFMLIWLSNISLLTFVSFLGIIITICDYFLPTVVCSFTKPEDWTVSNENILQKICADIVLYRTKFEILNGSLSKLKYSNSKLYFSLTIVTLSALAWIGSAINNLFLMYVLSTTILLLPGIDYNGLNSKITDSTFKFITELLNSKKQR